MKKPVIYTDAPGIIDEIFNSGSIIPDFLPEPKDLVKKITNTAVSLKTGKNICVEKIAFA